MNDVRELMKELLSVGNNLTQLTTRAKLMNLEVVDLKPTYMKLVEIYTVLTELLKRVKGLWQPSAHPKLNGLSLQNP